MRQQIHSYVSHLRDIFLSPVKTFVLLAAVFGLLFITLSPPFTGADEEAHFVRAYGISTGDFRLYDTSEVSVPSSLRKTIGCFQTKTTEPGTMYQYDYSEYGINKKAALACSLSLPLNEHDTEMVRTTAQPYSPVSYVPQTAAILIGRAVDAPLVVITYMVRFFALAAYIVLIAIAIKLLPVRRWALAGVALLPMSMKGLSNPGGDYLLLGMVAILAAVIIRSIYISKKQLQRENTFMLALLAVAAVIMLQPKGLFPGICALPLIAFYGGLSYQKTRKLIIAATALAIGVGWQMFGISTDLITANHGMNSLFDFPAAFIRTMLTRWVDTDFIVIGDYVGNMPAIGNHLGTPALIVTAVNILFAIYTFVAYPEKLKLQITKKQALILTYTGIVCALAIIVGSFAAIFSGASFMQAAGEPIRGVATRYFLPAFLILSVIPLTRKVFVDSETTMSKITIIGSTICLSAVILILLIRYGWWSLLSIT